MGYSTLFVFLAMTVTLAFTGQDAINCTDSSCQCTKIFDPVCGSDGITYNNFCLYKCARCTKDSTITVARNGNCNDTETTTETATTTTATTTTEANDPGPVSLMAADEEPPKSMKSRQAESTQENDDEPDWNPFALGDGDDEDDDDMDGDEESDGMFM